MLTPFVFDTGRPRRLTAEERARLETTYDDPPFADERPPRPAAWNESAYHRPIQVRFSDVDLLGHVNNVRYFDYVHEAQVEVMTGVFQEARISGTVGHGRRAQRDGPPRPDEPAARGVRRVVARRGRRAGRR